MEEIIGNAQQRNRIFIKDLKALSLLLKLYSGKVVRPIPVTFISLIVSAPYSDATIIRIQLAISVLVRVPVVLFFSHRKANI